MSDRAREHSGDDGVIDRAGVARRDGAEDPTFERLLQFLKESRGFDFTGYKRPSLMRRVRHRMREIGVDAFEDYQDILQLSPSEFTALFNTILINVTSFFRDSEAWDVLADDILPSVLANTEDKSLRVWSAGCASGEEAHSIAMLLHDAMGAEQFRERVKIYATDIDEDALNYARAASYTERELQGLPERFRDRYFDASNGRFAFTPDLRRKVIFGRNDLTRDAPISRIDILLCRNTLMYFNAETQAKIVSRLGFALRPEGVLFLGKAEMLLNHASVFEPIDLKRRFFRRIRSDVAEGAGFARHVSARRAVAAETSDMRNQLLMTNPIAQIAVGADGRLIMVNHRANAMLGVSDQDVGRPFQDLEVSYRPVELRSHLAAVAENRSPIRLREIEWRRSGPDPVYFDVQIAPVIGQVGDVLGASISFTDVTRFRQLRVEVETANRQLETAYEELQSSNEELETTNEELQSSNEELETMNEELQSANDELQTTNDQLRDRTLEVDDLNKFMQSILGSLDVAVIVVDRDLVVQVWTRQAYELWGLRDDETIGHHLLNLDSGLPAGTLHQSLRAVITGQERASLTHEIEAVNRRGRTVDLRITVTSLHEDGDGTEPSGALIVVEDITTGAG